MLKKEEPVKILNTEEPAYNIETNTAPISQNEDNIDDDLDDDFDDLLGGTTEQF